MDKLMTMMEKYQPLRTDLLLYQDKEVSKLMLRDLVVCYGPTEFAAMLLEQHQAIYDEHATEVDIAEAYDLVIEATTCYLEVMERIFGPRRPLTPHPEVEDDRPTG